MRKREEILRALFREREISGEKMAKALGVSRTAVWNEINRLRGMGFEIERHFGVGYRLVGVPDLILPEEIEEELSGRRLCRKVLVFSELPSTQDEAKKLAEEGAEEGVAVIAERQTRGRGRLGRRWDSGEGGVWLSLILRPPLHPSEVLRIPLMSGVAVAEALRELCGGDFKLKWPNDIYARGKKVGGILCELGAEADAVRYLILGIGINVNNSLPPELSDIATTLREECGRMLRRAEVIKALLSHLDELYDVLLEGDFETIRRRWLSLSEMMGAEVVLIDGKRRIEGRAEGVDEDGALLLRKPDGALLRVLSGDVSLRPAEGR